MASVQKQFGEFHEAIKLGRFKENLTLREKRDIIRGKLEERLRGVFEKHGEECPEFEFRDQGSYELGTGIKPLNGDYDIDQGLYFKVSTDVYPDPVVLKERVHEALEGHTADVCIRRPCVTVFYQREGESVYHVDIAIYSDGSQNPDGTSRLAKGKENSAQEYRFWEAADPEGLKDAVYARFEGTDRDQFRRIVRYLKRWKSHNFPRDGHAAPLGIGLTVTAYDDLQPKYSDTFAKTPDDLKALRDLVRAILNRFTTVWHWDELKSVRRLSVELPVQPYSGLFEQMTDKQMEAFEEKLKKLKEALDAADDEVDPVEACKKLQKVFGSDFPVPEPKDTGKRHAPAIVSSSSSA